MNTIPNIDYVNAQLLVGRSRITELITTKEFKKIIKFFTNPPSNNLEDLMTLLRDEEKVISFSSSVNAESGVKTEGQIKNLEIRIPCTDDVSKNMFFLRDEKVWVIAKEIESSSTFFVHGILDYLYQKENQMMLILTCDMFIAKNESLQGQLFSFLG